MSRNCKPRIKCFVCTLSTYELLLAEATTKNTIRYYNKLILEQESRIANTKPKSKLHLCDEIAHLAYADLLRENHKTITQESLLKRKYNYEEALRQFNELNFKYKASVITNGSGSEITRRLKIAMNHYKVLKGQRKRRYHEALEKTKV